VLNVFNLLQWCFDRLSPARSPHFGVNVSPRMAVPDHRFISRQISAIAVKEPGQRVTDWQYATRVSLAMTSPTCKRAVSGSSHPTPARMKSTLVGDNRFGVCLFHADAAQSIALPSHSEDA
jgi:hypothetical protein